MHARTAACRSMPRNAAECWECRDAAGCRGMLRNAAGSLGMQESAPKLNARQDRSMSQHAAECCGMPRNVGMLRDAAECCGMPRNAGMLRKLLRNAAECRDAAGCSKTECTPGPQHSQHAAECSGMPAFPGIIFARRWWQKSNNLTSLIRYN